MKGKGEEKEEEEAECGREEMGETQESTEERCKGCKAGWPRLLGFARRFAYRFSCATVSYDGKRRAISLNFVEELATTLASWLRLNTLVSHRYSLPKFLPLSLSLSTYIRVFGSPCTRFSVR